MLFAAASLLPGVAMAQSQPQGAGESVSSGEIIVTARRREEALQDVPISVTAIGGEALARSGAADALSLQTRVPSLSITNQGTSRNELGFAIRGQRTQESQLLTDPPVGTYFAEVVQARSLGFAYAMYDIQSTQVLKGVQGTLFGRNMTGGAVLIEPNKPTDRFEGELRGQVGNYNLRDLYGMVNVPLGDKAALRVAGKTRSRDGFTTDVLTGRDYDDQNYNTFRVSLRLNPTEALETTTIFDYIKTDEHGTALVGGDANAADPNTFGNYAYLSSQGYPATDPVAQFAAQKTRARYTFASGFGRGGQFDAYGKEPYEKLENWGIANRTTYDLGGLTLKNIFGYRHLKYDQVMDLDGVPSALIHSNRYRNIKQISEEFQGSGKALGDRLDYVAGVYYFRESGQDGSTSSQFPELAVYFGNMLGGSPTTTPASVLMNAYSGSGRAETAAVYAAGTYALSDQIKVSAGIRYTDDKRRVTVMTYYPNQGACFFRLANGTSPTTLATCPQSNSASWNAVTWDATLQYEPSQNFTVYASTRKGFRAGGFSLRAASVEELAPFNPEKVQEYELGVKTQNRIGGALVTLNGALFYQDYSNVQKQTSSIDSAGNVNTIINNTAKQRNYGGELELSVSSGGFNLNAFYSYVGVDIIKGRQVGEYELVGAPHHQLGANLSYETELPGTIGTLNLNANVSHKGAQYLDKNDRQAFEKAYTLVNLRAGVGNVGGTGLGLAAFVNNLTKTYYRVGVIGIYNEAGYISNVYGEPRTYGLEVSYKF